jgi:hypothetical protein|tara:strand:+ start:468 stop:659 length:192 start_codon:yes stop_codon:yes gene_type:complete
MAGTFLEEKKLQRKSTYYLDDDPTISWAIVEITQDDLLPGAQRQFAVDDWYRKGWPEQGGAHM